MLEDQLAVNLSVKMTNSIHFEIYLDPCLEFDSHLIWLNLYFCSILNEQKAFTCISSFLCIIHLIAHVSRSLKENKLKPKPLSELQLVLMNF